MAEQLKHLINEATARDTAEAMTRAWPAFSATAFLDHVLPRIGALELMQRGQLIADGLRLHLPENFAQAQPILAACLPDRTGNRLRGWALLSFNQYIAANGLGHLDLALDLLKRLTPHFTAEFGIRPFIHGDQERALAEISGWTKSPDPHVRRLASEGTRPRLPWAMRLPSLVRDPAPILPIIEALIDDGEDYVRRSVANSLNDIAKDHPDLVADFVERHIGDASANRRWLLKHASRTLIKKGHPKALANFGFARLETVTATLTIAQTTVPFPGTLEFEVALENTGTARETVMLDYAIHHRRKDGTLSPKVFKGTSLTLEAGERKVFGKRHALRPITTRTYYPGEHRLEIAINGAVLAGGAFVLAGGEQRGEA